jgi:hypothetical protein
MSSSNEDIAHNGAASEDDDDNRTALGTLPNEPFTPQPNAFSHPPSASRPSQDSYFPRVTSAPSSHIHNRSTRSRPHLQRERERTGMASSYQHAHDHDAALRASLTTLLSCAAAVRPKPQHSPSTNSGDKDKPAATERPAPTRQSNQPTIMRLIPESQLNAPTDKSSTTNRSKINPKRRARSRSNSKDRLPKKNKMSNNAAYSYDDYLISPTVASWVISAGMVLVFSAISFSAGYAWGREVGRIEGEMGLAGGGGSCSKEALRGSRGVTGWGRASVVQ